MESIVIRKKFLEFFAMKGHEMVQSAPMVIKDDPTLMFTNAGMNQFKDIFLGNANPKSLRVANSQKCLRVSGKHNDLEEVGVDTYHHTMFEMLGNWSFGDYFKKEAIEWAWELLTEVYQIDKKDLYVSIFGGDEQDGLEEDTEAADIWGALVPQDRILRCDKKDNFWEMGETGPCGPCSEIHIDLRSQEEKAQVPGKDLVNADHPQVIEIWNLVFMEFNRSSDGSLSSLPAKHIDTGMGFERLAVVLQGKKSNYDTDVFQPLIQKIVDATGVPYGRTQSKQDIAIRVISDHVRAVAFAIADGQLPSNTGAGYVIRRILRRAVRYGFSFLNMREPFIYNLVEVLAKQMGDYFPELRDQADLIKKVIHEEEENFLRTLDKGIHRLNDILKSSDDEVSGKAAFELYDTYGFPADLTALIAAESGKSMDQVGFEKELDLQKERSRSAGKVETGDWVILKDDDVEEFVGYDQLITKIHITRYRKVTQKGKEMIQLVFDHTPFYPEGGGQVGDKGRIYNEQEDIAILDTKKENNLIIHFTSKLPSNPKVVFTAEVDHDLRISAARNHTATHLLHEVLREELGDHVTQKGSLVHPDYLRFDFSHFSKLSEEDLESIESKVNARIRSNHMLNEYRNIPLDEAQDKGAMMLFGEKYGDVVRMIEFGESRELCGGIHVNATGEIGTFRITSETAVASGIRRIEALTGARSFEAIRGERQEINAIRKLLKAQKDLVGAVEEMLNKNSMLEKNLNALKKEQAGDVKKELMSKIKDVNGVNVLIEKVDLGAGEIKDIAFQLKGEVPRLFAVIGSGAEGKATLTCVISDELVSEKDLNAGNIIRQLAKSIQGGGGGQAFFATAGGKKLEGINEALKNAEALIS